MITEQECYEKIQEAILRFGEYNWYDKGPDQVMDMNAIVAKTKDMPAAAIIGEILLPIRAKKYGEDFTRTLLGMLDDRDDFDLICNTEGLEDLY